MKLDWDYKIDLEDEGVFSNIEKSRDITIPDNLKKLIIAENGASPKRYCFMLGNNEKMFGAVLSFNKDDIDTVYTALEVVEDRNLLPFGIDPFGNYICLNLDSGEVEFYDYETEKVESTGNKLDAFLESLY